MFEGMFQIAGGIVIAFFFLAIFFRTIRFIKSINYRMIFRYLKSDKFIILMSSFLIMWLGIITKEKWKIDIRLILIILAVVIGFPVKIYNDRKEKNNKNK